MELLEASATYRAHSSDGICSFAALFLLCWLLFLQNVLNSCSASEAFMTCGRSSCHLSIDTKSSALLLLCLHYPSPWDTFLLFQLIFMGLSLLPFLIVRQRKIQYHPLAFLLNLLLSAMPIKNVAKSWGLFWAHSILQQWMVSHFLSTLSSSQRLSRCIHDVQESQGLFCAHVSLRFMERGVLVHDLGSTPQHTSI